MKFFKLSFVLISLQFFYCDQSLFAQSRELFILNRGEDNILSLALDSASASLSARFGENVVAGYDIITNTDSAKVIWTSRFPNRIGTGKQGDSDATLANFSGTPVDLDIDFSHQKIYWADNLLGKVCRSNLDGSGREFLNGDSLPNLSSVAIYTSQNRLYFADLDSITIWSSSLDGTNRQLFWRDTQGYPVRLLVDTIQQKLYWADDGLHRIERINLDGTNREVFYQGDSTELPFGLFIDQVQSKLYWTDYGLNTVARSDINVPAVEIVVDQGLNDPIAVTILEPSVEQRSSMTSDRFRPTVAVYPNPVNDNITFSSLSKKYSLSQISIIDLMGKRVLTQKVNQYVAQLDTAELGPGYYSYMVLIDDQLVTGHFSVIH